MWDERARMNGVHDTKRFGFFCPNLPKPQWWEFKALREDHGLSTRQAILLLLECYRYILTKPELAERVPTKIITFIKASFPDP